MGQRSTGIALPLPHLAVDLDGGAAIGHPNREGVHLLGRPVSVLAGGVLGCLDRIAIGFLEFVRLIEVMCDSRPGFGPVSISLHEHTSGRRMQRPAAIRGQRVVDRLANAVMDEAIASGHVLYEPRAEQLVEAIGDGEVILLEDRRDDAHVEAPTHHGSRGQQMFAGRRESGCTLADGRAHARG